MRLSTCLVGAALLTLVLVPAGAERAHASAPAYPGIYPALTASYAATLQAAVNRGQHLWLRDASAVALAFARHQGWGHGATQAVSQSPTSARSVLVTVYDRQTPQLRLIVRERRQSRASAIWSVTACWMDNLRLTASTVPQPANRPLLVRGRVRVFEGAFKIVVLGQGGRWAGQRRLTVPQGNYTQPVPFQTLVKFVSGAPFAVVKATSRSARDGSLALLAMIKVAVVR